MKVALRNGIAVLVLVAVVYFVANYSGLIKEKVGVQGASTERAQEISGKLGSDVSGQVNVIASKAGEVKVNDIVGFFVRFEKIPQDIGSAKEYLQEQVDRVVKFGEKKK